MITHNMMHIKCYLIYNHLLCLCTYAVRRVACLLITLIMIKLIQQSKNFHKQVIMQKRIYFVFDVDGTLVHRTRDTLPNVQPHFKANKFSVYLRPNLHYLAHHQQKLAESSRFLLWTSMQRHNAEEVAKHLLGLGLKFDKIYCQQHCREDLSKDLNVIAKQLEADLDSIYLIDDSPRKRIGSQNFIHIEQFSSKIDPTDKQLIRIVQQLYKIVEIEMDEKYNKEAHRKEEESQDKLRNKAEEKLKKNENNYMKNEKKNQGKEEDKEEVKEQEKVKHHKAKKERGQKFFKSKIQKQQQQQKNQNGWEENKAQPMKFNQNTKVIVFDLSKTLIAKKKQEIQALKHLRNPSNIQGNLVYNRPYLNIIQQFLHVHRNNHEIKLIVWTTMTGKKVVRDCREVVNNLGIKFQDVINGVESKQNPGKDLSKVCQTYGCKLQNVVLVDDSHYKNIEGQHFIHIFPYKADSEDIQMIRMVGKLDEFIGCQDAECEIKKIVKEYKQKLDIAEIKHKEMLQQEKIKKQQQKANQIEILKEVYQNKKQQVKHQQKQQEEQTQVEENFKIKPQIKQGTHIKCIVFDINETLLIRSHKKIEEVKYNSNNKHYYNYLRPHLKELKEFMEKYDVVACLWSTITQKNCIGFVELLAKSGLTFYKLFSGDKLVNGKKDLNVVAQALNISLENIVLVDDSRKKRVVGQNFIQISAFNPENQQDDSLLFLISEFEKVCNKKQQ